MAKTHLGGAPVTTQGDLPVVGSPAPHFTLVDTELRDVTSADFASFRVVLNVFPSVDTGICASSVRRFNKLAAGLEGTMVLCVSQDLPFALARFCGAEGIENVKVLSAFRSSFGRDYGMGMIDGALAGLLARAVVVIEPGGQVSYTQLSPDIKQEIDYQAVLAALN